MKARTSKTPTKAGEKIMRNKYVQISLMDTYTGVLEAMETNKSELVRLLDHVRKDNLSR